MASIILIISEALQDGVIDLRYYKSDEQVVDIFTKALPKDHFNYLKGLLGVKPVNNLECCNVNSSLV